MKIMLPNIVDEICIVHAVYYMSDCCYVQVSPENYPGLLSFKLHEVRCIDNKLNGYWLYLNDGKNIVSGDSLIFSEYICGIDEYIKLVDFDYATYKNFIDKIIEK
jgi:hypothetical protein